MNYGSQFLNTSVFTTVYVMEHTSPIIYVSHDIKGDWQFLGPETIIDLDQGRIVWLSEILEKDPSVASILTISKGMDAYREGLGKAWIRITKKSEQQLNACQIPFYFVCKHAFADLKNRSCFNL